MVLRRSPALPLDQLGSRGGEGSVVITKNGRPCAVLMPVTEDTDLEVLALSQNKRFWVLYDRARKRAERKGWTRLQDGVYEYPRCIA